MANFVEITDKEAPILSVKTSPSLEMTNLQAWNICNDIVTLWILNSLSKKIADSVIYSKTVKEIWISLEHRFGQSNGAKLYHIQKELSRLIQGTSNIAGYFTKLKRLWDELDSLNTNVKCNCDENQRESYINSTVSPDSYVFMVENSHQYRVSKHD
ncbi:uncharacterized protein LOC125847274 [Solanum stenotomum]|uniref:uncharacterized protein LOC125847274 n=1 Tax=Solanum stenotomum TaxID=172797 RepID=UPI0020D14768|nr:uncharacterized protein LOC125847274 [Solanum stenotomum]